MAKFRMVHTSFWDDPKVVEELTPEDKYFFLYLLTNSNTTQIGIYQITKKQMAFDLGYSMESVNSLLDRFISHHGMVEYNPETREIAIKNWGRYNLNRGGKPMLDCVTSELKEVKDKELIKYVSSQVKRDDIKAIYDSYDDTCTSRFEENDESSKQENSDENSHFNENDTTTEEASHINGSYDTSTTRPQYKEEEKEEEEYKDRVRDLFDHFVSKNIIRHKRITSAMRTATNARLRDYTFDELIKAIDNYALVYNSKNHWFTHKYPFADFMRDKDVRRFLEEADPVNNFAIRDQKAFANAKKVSKEDFDLT